MLYAIFFTVLKHKNVCRYVGNTLSSHTRSSKNNATASYSALKCVFRVGMSVFVLVCVIPPTANLPNSISTHQVAS